MFFNASHSQRLDKHLSGLQVPELYSRAFIESLIQDGMITVNNLTAKKSYLLQQGDKIEINLPEQPSSDIIPQDIKLDIVFEDEFLAVINKPADMVVHPGFGNHDNTLVNAIVFRYGDSLPSGTSLNRPGIVHRLDKGTSGLLLIAKNDAAHSILSDMFAQRKVKKTYLAITSGIPEPAQGRIENLIVRSNANPRKMVVGNTGRLSATSYEVIHYYHYFALCKVNLETGRMHQIRVHFADQNFPVLGDMLYSSTKYTQSIVPQNMKRKVLELLGSHLKRQALHAWKLEFEHPYTKKLLTFVAPLPDDIVYTLNWLENYFAIDNVRYDKKLMNESVQ